MGEHSWFSPSKANRAILCPASLSLEMEIRKKEEEDPTASVYAERGTECHTACEQYDMVGVNFDDIKFEESWQAQACNDAIRQREAILPDSAEILTEVKVDLGNYGHEDIFGTADVLAWDKKTRSLYVIDYKFGAGVAVKPIDNPQLNIYALGALANYMNVEAVFQVIIQPRIYDQAYVHETTVAKLEAWFETVLSPVIEKAKEGTEFNPSDEACRWCPGSHGYCEAAKNRFIDMLPKIESAETSEDPEFIAEILEQKQFIIQTLNKIESKAIKMMQDDGIEIPGYKLVRKFGHTTWKDTKKADSFLRNLKFKEKERYSFKIISPAKAKKEITNKGAMTTRRMNRLNALTHRPDRGVIIVPTSDPRDAIDIKPAIERLPKNDTLEDLL